jgi:hypothetical protein
MLHLVPNDSTAGTLRRALPDADVLGFPDLLTDGRARPFTAETLDAWFADRAQFYAETFGYGGEIECFHAIRDHLAGDETPLTLWAGTTMGDQLFVAWTAALLRALDRHPPVSLVQLIEKPDAYFPFIGAGATSEKELRAAPAAQPLGATELDRYSAAWDAWIAPDPVVLDDFIAKDPKSHLSIALTARVLRFPLEKVGLNWFEEGLLKNVSEKGPRLVYVVGHTMGDRMDSADWVSDAWLFWRLRRMASPALRHPLLQIDQLSLEMHGRNVELTEHGRAVLAGEADAADLNGYDDWVGGVHVQIPPAG